MPLGNRTQQEASQFRMRLALAQSMKIDARINCQAAIADAPDGLGIDHVRNRGRLGRCCLLQPWRAVDFRPAPRPGRFRGAAAVGRPRLPAR